MEKESKAKSGWKALTDEDTWIRQWAEEERKANEYTVLNTRARKLWKTTLNGSGTEKIESAISEHTAWKTKCPWIDQIRKGLPMTAEK